MNDENTCADVLHLHGFTHQCYAYLLHKYSYEAAFLNLWTVGHWWDTAQFSSGPRSCDKIMSDYSYVDI